MALLPGIPTLPFLLPRRRAPAARRLVTSTSAREVQAARLHKAADQAAGGTAPTGGADLRPRSRSTISRSSSATGCCRWSTRRTAATALTEQIKALRRSLAIEMGFVMPAVRILDNVQLDANSYVIKIKEVDARHGSI